MVGKYPHKTIYKNCVIKKHTYQNCTNTLMKYINCQRQYQANYNKCSAYLNPRKKARNCVSKLKKILLSFFLPISTKNA